MGPHIVVGQGRVHGGARTQQGSGVFRRKAIRDGEHKATVPHKVGGVAAIHALALCGGGVGGDWVCELTHGANPARDKADSRKLFTELHDCSSP